VARKSDKVRQESKAEQSRREDVGEECGVPRGKCAAKGRSYGERGGQIMQRWGDNGECKGTTLVSLSFPW